MAQVTVRFFARYAELAGCQATSVEVAESATVSEVLERMRETVPGARELPDRPFTVLNFKQVKLDARVSDGDEVALLPPFSGG
jgi:molybdopterin converting factor small subunit